MEKQDGVVSVGRAQGVKWSHSTIQHPELEGTHMDPLAAHSTAQSQTLWLRAVSQRSQCGAVPCPLPSGAQPSPNPPDPPLMQQ